MTYPFVQAANDYGPRKGPMLAFLVHIAEGGGTVGFLSRSNPRGVSVHYVIEYSGRIVQMLREDHASGSVNPQEIRTDDDKALYGATVAKQVMGDWWQDPNSAVISVEMEGFASTGPSLAQQTALVNLVADVRSRYPKMGLLGHRDFQNYKPCPGLRIPWGKLGGHGPAAEVDVPWFPIRVPGGARAGSLAIPTGTELFPVSGAPSVKAGSAGTSATTGLPGTSAIHDVDGGSPGFIYTDPIGITYWVRAADVGFTPTDCSAQVQAAVAKEHEDNRKAALKAVDEAIP